MVNKLKKQYKELENILTLKEYTTFSFALSSLITGVVEIITNMLNLIQTTTTVEGTMYLKLHLVAYMIILITRYVLSRGYLKQKKTKCFNKHSFTMYSMGVLLIIALLQILFIFIGGLKVTAIIATLVLLIYQIKTLKTVSQGVQGK